MSLSLSGQRTRQMVMLALISVALLVIAGAVAFIIVPGAPNLTGIRSAEQHAVATVTPFDLSSPVAQENKQAGTSDWELDAGANMRYIQGYASQVSALPGTDVALYVSSMAAIPYHYSVYRIGWYQGKGGRLYATSPEMVSTPQGYWTPTEGLMHCASCTLDAQTHEVDAHWKISAMLHIGADWASGVYLIKLETSNRAQSYIPLVVRADSGSSAALVSLSVSTYNAYNLWGGYSLYGRLGDDDETTFPGRATHVSFNRPYDRSAGASDFLSWDIHTIRWLERSAFDVSYTTSIDLDQASDLIMHHRIFIAVGHDEYWTWHERAGVEQARASGVSLAFLGANDMYWQARIEADSAGNQGRTVVCYKVQSTPDNNAANAPTERLSNDPLAATHPELVTAQWRDAAINRPENSVVGSMYISYFYTSSGYSPDWVVNSGPLDPLMAETGLTPGQHIKGGLLGYEYDGVIDNGQAPKDLVILSSSPIRKEYGKSQEINMATSTYYYAPSGALIFDAGSIWWGWGLDDSTPPGASSINTLKGNQAISLLTSNILHAMLIASPPPPSVAAPIAPTAIAQP